MNYIQEDIWVSTSNYAIANDCNTVFRSAGETFRTGCLIKPPVNISISSINQIILLNSIIAAVV